MLIGRLWHANLGTCAYCRRTHALDKHISMLAPSTHYSTQTASSVATYFLHFLCGELGKAELTFQHLERMFNLGTYAGLELHDLAQQFSPCQVLTLLLNLSRHAGFSGFARLTTKLTALSLFLLHANVSPTPSYRIYATTPIANGSAQRSANFTNPLSRTLAQ